MKEEGVCLHYEAMQRHTAQPELYLLAGDTYKRYCTYLYVEVAN